MSTPNLKASNKGSMIIGLVFIGMMGISIGFCMGLLAYYLFTH